MKHSEIIWHIRAAKIANKLPRETELENTEDLKHNPAHCSAHEECSGPIKYLKNGACSRHKPINAFPREIQCLTQAK